MFDELDHLRDDPALLRLLAHYADLGAADRETWQDRLMHLDGVQPRELTRLHGELIAFAWVDQNTGVTPPGRPGVVAGCYRVTSLGVRALKRARREVPDEEEDALAA